MGATALMVWVIEVVAVRVAVEVKVVVMVVKEVRMRVASSGTMV